VGSSVDAKELAKYLEPLTRIQQLYVKARLEGMSKFAAATAAGISNPRANGGKIEKSAAVREALRVGRELLAAEVLFTRKQAHQMLMEAYANADTATEQVLAIREMIKLHGVAAPEVKELRHQVTGKVEHEEVKRLSDSDLLRLAQLPTERVPQVLEAEYDIIEDDRPADEKVSDSR